ncbi:deoxynucleoside kinase [Brachybacterium sp. JHP9]|uniref:Deoxynucleoside kinase n=1 Tax=Brachybacterium equifaecis TaxID=2910770 RepID=A0ABT0QYX6_9MICO|nr:deoxynucleoside kinase [Brachybacterium equifaecis]
MKNLFVAVEGPIGVGKTSLMHRLAEQYGLREERELVAENPFFSSFYADIPRWAFQTEMFFLTSRYTQLRDLGQDARGVVADYHIHKNLIFARRTLGPAELDKLLRVYDVLTEGLIQPDLTIFLDAELPVLRERIALRAREEEVLIQDQYLENLRADYRDYYESLTRSGGNALFLDTTGTDFVHDEADFARILETIRTAAGETR